MMLRLMRRLFWWRRHYEEEDLCDDCGVRQAVLSLGPLRLCAGCSVAVYEEDFDDEPASYAEEA